MSSLKKNGSTQAWRAIRQQALERDHHTCQHCGNEGNEVDHIIERRHGGDDSLHNLQTLCQRCHTAKTTQNTRQTVKRSFFGDKQTPTDSPWKFLSPTVRLSPFTPFEQPE